MNNEFTLTEVISELDRISFLYDKYKSLEQDMDNVSNEKEEEDQELLSDVAGTLDEFKKAQNAKFSANRPLISAPRLATPTEAPKKPDLKNPVKDILISSLIGLVTFALVALVAIGIVITPLADAMGMLAFFLPFVMIVAIWIWFANGAPKVTKTLEWQKAEKEWEEKQAEWEAKFNKSVTKEDDERFINEFKEFDAAFLSMVDVCSQKYDKEFKRYSDGLEAIKEKYIQKLDNIHEEAKETLEQLHSNTIIHSDLFDIAWRISSILKTGRADSLKEAINLALDEERKDMEEAARRAEARQQEAILEQQARDNRMHNEAMARAAEEEARAQRAHNAAMERAAEAQARAAEAQAREAAKQTAAAAQQARDASNRCRYCANVSKCSYVAKKNAANCAAYRPR